MKSLVQDFESSNALALANQGVQEEGKNEWVGPFAEDTKVVSFWNSLVSEQLLQLRKPPSVNDQVSWGGALDWIAIKYWSGKMKVSRFPLHSSTLYS